LLVDPCSILPLTRNLPFPVVPSAFLLTSSPRLSSPLFPTTWCVYGLPIHSRFSPLPHFHRAIHVGALPDISSQCLFMNIPRPLTPCIYVASFISFPAALFNLPSRFIGTGFSSILLSPPANLFRYFFPLPSASSYLFCLILYLIPCPSSNMHVVDRIFHRVHTFHPCTNVYVLRGGLKPPSYSSVFHVV